jgi:hypothetical protein
VGGRAIETLNRWLTPALLVAVVGLLWLIYASDPALVPTVVHPAPPAPVPPVVRPDPPPVVTPDPPVVTPDPPAPRPSPGAPASPLTRAVKDYLDTTPRALRDLAAGLESGEIKDKAAAVAFAKKHSAAMAAALDQVFSPGVDPSGKVTNAGAIAGPLRETADALESR